MNITSRAALVLSMGAAAIALTGCGRSTSPTAVGPASTVTTAPAPAGSTGVTAPGTGRPSLNPVVNTPQSPPYLGDGRTGDRGQVPWTAVGPGWRLIQPGGYIDPQPSIYLYDLAGGRYLITDRAPASSRLVIWSPDGRYATFNDDGQLHELDLHNGRFGPAIAPQDTSILSYTRPNGTAELLDGDAGLRRVGLDGTLQQTYPSEVGGVGRLGYQALYTDDGTAFVIGSSGPAMLMGNGGNPIRKYPLPTTHSTFCNPQAWWSSDVFVEKCYANPGPDGLYLQSVAGGAPTTLSDQPGPIGFGYGFLGRLSNGDTLLAGESGCGPAVGYFIRHQNGSVVNLRLPAGVPVPALISAADRDQVTFTVSTYHGCGDPGRATVTLIDYDVVTGHTSTLLHEDAIIESYPR